MTAASSEASPGFLKSLIQLICYGGILVAFGSFAYTQFYGNPFRSLMGDNLLEAATQPGVSDKSRMDAFKNAGGLDKESTWKAFQVRKYEAVYRPDGKLAMINFTLVKSWPGKQLASLDNLRAAMTPQCGSSWSSSNVGNASVLQTKDSPAGFTCSALDQGQEDIVVSIANMVAGDASAQAPAPRAQATPSPNIATAPSANSTQAQANSQATAATDGVQTVAGNLVAVVKENGGSPSILKLSGRVVFDGSDSAIKIEKTFAIEGKTLVLLSISDGGTACPAIYRILSIAPDSRIFTSDEFGTCSDLPKTSAGQASLMISMPNMDGKDESSWMFSGETLNQVRGGPRKK